MLSSQIIPPQTQSRLKIIEKYHRFISWKSILSNIVPPRGIKEYTYIIHLCFKELKSYRTLLGNSQVFERSYIAILVLPRASITTIPPEPAKEYNRLLFSVKDSMNGCPR